MASPLDFERDDLEIDFHVPEQVYWVSTGLVGVGIVLYYELISVSRVDYSLWKYAFQICRHSRLRDVT